MPSMAALFVMDLSNACYDQLQNGLDIQFGANDMQVHVGASIRIGTLHAALAVRNRALPLKSGTTSVLLVSR